MKGCKWRLVWALKRSKTDTTWEKGYEKTIIVDKAIGAIAAGDAIREMLALRNIRGKSKEENIPVFPDPSTTEEVDIECAKRKPLTNITEAGLSHLAIKGHSLSIGGASGYANSGPNGSITPRFIGILDPPPNGSTCLHRKGNLEEEGLKIGRETGQSLGKRPGPANRTETDRGWIHKMALQQVAACGKKGTEIKNLNGPVTGYIPSVIANPEQRLTANYTVSFNGSVR